MDIEYYKRQLMLKDLKITSLEHLLDSYKKEKVFNIKRISKLSNMTSILLNIDEDDKLHLLIDGKFDIALEQNYISNDDGYCYVCLHDGTKLIKFSCGHGVCNSCFIKNINKKVCNFPITIKCLVCKKDIKNIINF